MNINYKFYTCLLIVGLLLQTVAAAQTSMSETGSDEIAPELKQEVLIVLRETARETQRFSLPENRVRAQTIAADLMWEHDEQAAREIFQNALIELQRLFADAVLPDAQQLTVSEKSALYPRRFQLADLRGDFVLALAGRDAQAALDALAALKPPLYENGDPLAADKLELEITTALVKSSPDKSYALAKEQLGANGLTHRFVDALKLLHEKDSELAAKLAADAYDQIKTIKIAVPPVTGTATRTDGKTAVDFWQISTFINAAMRMNLAAAKDKTKKSMPLLSDDDMKQLVETTAGSYLKAPDAAPLSISTLISAVRQYSPALEQRIRLKIGAEASRQMDRVVESNSYYYESREKSADELAEEAGRAEERMRDHRYSYAAYKALREDGPEKAQAIADRIKDRKVHAYLFEQIQAAVPLAKARRGELAEVRKMLYTIKSSEKRVITLIELAAALVARDEKETAKTLLDESLQMMPPRIGNSSDLILTAKIAGIYSSVAPGRAFTIIENGIAQSNEYINSGIRMDEFFSKGSVRANELLFGSINRQFSAYVPDSYDLLKNLGRADLERAVGLADRFERPEIRLFVRLKIIQALLDTKAAGKKKPLSEEFDGDEDI